MVPETAATTESATSNVAVPGFLNDLAPYVHWGIRAVLAGVFLFHGLTKFPTIAGFASMMGLPLGVAYLVAIAETLAGVLVLAGGFRPDWHWLTRAAGAIMIVVMVGAIAMVHWGQWSFVPSDTHPMGGMEFQTLLVVIGAYLAVRGNDL